ncbi:MAG TPA: tRNA lysidine(34) synthetase TilS, partial [Oculatellaceae cyanobacterium]
EVFRQDRRGPYLDAVRFNQLDVAYQRRILKRFLTLHYIFADFQTIEDILDFIQGNGRGNLTTSLKSMPKGNDGKDRFLSLYKDQLRLIEGPRPSPTKESIPVSIPGILPLPALQRTFKALAWQAPEKVKISPIRPHDSQQVFVDLSAFADKPLEIRTRRPGDKFHPMGMDTPVRLKKFLINRGVPRFERDQLLLLAYGQEVLWIPGLGISKKIMVQPNQPPTHLLKLMNGIHPEEETLCPPIREDRLALDETDELPAPANEEEPEDIIDSLDLEIDAEALDTEQTTGAHSS